TMMSTAALRPPTKAPTPATGSLRTSTSALPPATAAPADEPGRPSAAQFASGLSAAYTSETPAADLGALGGGDAAFSLSSLDGEEAPSSGGSFDMPAQEPMPASIGPAVPPGPAAEVKVRTTSAPLDLFAPPDAEEAAANVELHTDEVDERAKLRASASAESMRAAAAPPMSPQLTRRTPVMMEAVTEPGAAATAGSLTRRHFAAGVFLSVLLAFVPVHIIAGMRESAASAEIDRTVQAAYAQAHSPERYEALDQVRAQQLEAKRDRHWMIGMTSMLLWAVLAAGVAYVWFRKIPWDRVSGGSRV
nr:hypothetical protein [Deltaproteobacteria bacterium]